MHKCLNLPSYAVVETSTIVQVNKTVSYPFSRANRIIDLVQKIERSINSILIRNLPHCNCSSSSFSIVAKNICTILGGNANHGSTVRPVNLLCSNVNLTDKFTTVPIVKQNGSISTSYPNQMSTEKTFRRRSSRLDSLGFFKVLEYLYTRNAFTNSIVTSSSSRPNEIKGLSKSLVTKRLRGVNDKFSITTNSNETSIAVMLQHLRVQLTRTQITRNNRETFTIRKALLLSSPRCKTTDIGSLNIIVFSPNDFSGRIHGCNRIITSQLYNNATFIKTTCKHIRFLRCSKRPSTFHTVVKSGFSAISGARPKSNSSIFRSGGNQGKLRVKKYRTNVMGVSLKGMDNGFGL